MLDFSIPFLLHPPPPLSSHSSPSPHPQTPLPLHPCRITDCLTCFFFFVAFIASSGISLLSRLELACRASLFCRLQDSSQQATTADAQALMQRGRANYNKKEKNPKKTKPNKASKISKQARKLPCHRSLSPLFRPPAYTHSIAPPRHVVRRSGVGVCACACGVSWGALCGCLELCSSPLPFANGPRPLLAMRMVSG